jgi:hypothetical protein
VKKKSKWADDDGVVAKPEKLVEIPRIESKTATNPIEKAAIEVPKENKLLPPQGYQGKPLKDWYRKVNNGVLPHDWRDRPAVTVAVTKPVKPEAKTETAIAGAMTVAQNQKTDKMTFVNTMPVISGDKQREANEFIKKYIGDGSAIIIDPVESAKAEAKHAKFHELMAGSGIKSVEDLQRWTTAFKFAFVKNHPEAAALALIELSNLVRDLQENGDKKLGELTGTEGTDATPPVSEPSTPSPAETPEPEKKVARGASRWA